MSNETSKGAEWSADEKWTESGWRVDDALEKLQQTRVHIQKCKQTNSRNFQRTTDGNRTETGRKADGKWTESGRRHAVRKFCLGRRRRPSVFSWTELPSKSSVHFPSTFRPLSVRLVWMVLIIIPGHVSDHFWVYKLPAEARLDMLPSTFHPPSFECS